MSQSLIGICSRHPDRDGLWVAEHTYLCTECAAKEIVVLNSVTRDTVTGQPMTGDPMRPMRRIIGQLLHANIDHLWYSSPDAMPDDATAADRDDFLGCCPECCAPCTAILDLTRAGWLDAWVRFWPDTLPGTSWWDEANQRVDRAWLARAWGQTDKLGCHHE